MNKLVLKNPVLRFKLGKKIIKAEDGWRLLNGRAVLRNVNNAYVTRQAGDKKLTQRYIFAGKQYGSFDGGKTYYGLDEGGRPLSYKANQQLLAAIGRRNKPKKVVDDSRGTGGIGNTGGSSFYQFGKMGGWNRSMGSSIDQDSLNKLLEMGYDTNNINAKKIQDEINNVFGPHAVKSDDKWGNLSKAGLLALYERWKSLLPTTTETKTVDINSPSKVLNSTVINQEPLTPEQLTDRAIVNNVDNLQFRRNGNYNKSGIRDLIRSYGLKAYDFTGALRKALRLYLNGESNDTSLLTDGLEKFIVPYKQGGQLVSRNPILRFKQKKFLVGGPVTTLKTGGSIPIYKRGGINNTAEGKRVLNFLRQLNKILKTKIKVDGYWGKSTQAAYELAQKLGFANQNGNLVKVLPEINIQARPQYAGIITSSNSSLTYKPWRPTEKVGVVGACGTENCSEWANNSLRNYKDSKGRVLYTYDNIGGDAWTRLSAGKHAKMIYSGYDGMDYDPNNYDYNLATQRNWLAALNLYDNFDSKTLDKNKTYLVNMYYNGSPQTENAWRNGTNGTTGTHTGNLYWNPETNSWRVAHNIHNKLYDDDFIKIQGVRKGKHQYGVTAIAEAPMVDYTRQDWNEAHPIKAAINRIYDFGMWKEGGKLKKKLIKALYGTELPEVTVTAIDVNKHAGSPQHRKFIRALNSNRNEFMNKYNLSDLEYADLSKFALNLSGAESSNGYDRNVFKRTYIYPDWMIHLGKLWRRGKDSANSRGLTQIKYDDDIKNPDLLKYYIDLGITGRNIKYDPNSMAKATLGRTLWILDLLKKQYGDLPIHYADGTEMPQEIAQYLYWNRGKVTDKANGNPETGSTIGAANLIKYYNSRKNI